MKIIKGRWYMTTLENGVVWKCLYSRDEDMNLVEVRPPKPLVRKPLMTTKECWEWMRVNCAELVVDLHGEFYLCKRYSKDAICHGSTFRQAVTRASRKTPA